MQRLLDVGEVLHVPRLVKFQIVREPDDVGVGRVFAEQNLDRISRDKVREIKKTPR